MTFLFAEPSGHYRANRTILALSCLHPSVDALPASQDETLPDKLLAHIAPLGSDHISVCFRSQDGR